MRAGPGDEFGYLRADLASFGGVEPAGRGRSFTMKLLFVAGSPRSGTTALANYLNQHQEVLICRERYKYVSPKKIDPSTFAFERILDYRDGETNIPKEYHEQILREKDPAKLKWVGDKYPFYVKRFEKLLKNNPGSRFIVLYRPVEEVAESFEARARDPRINWPAENGFEAGVRVWNSILLHTRGFIESNPDAQVLIVDYHDFFYRNEACVPLISRFLDLEFDEPVREAWKEMSASFEKARRHKEALSAERAAFIQENKDHATERWILDYINEQWKEPRQTRKTERTDRVGELKGRLAQERRRNRRLRERNRRLTARARNLQLRLQEVQNSTTWKLLTKLGSVRATVRDRTDAPIPGGKNPEEKGGGR